MTMEKLGREFMKYPKGWRKAAFKAPLILWRMGLGPWMGRIFTVITTTGRKTGLPRHTLTEYHVMDAKIYVPSAWAPKADWYKNIMADPHVTLQTWQGAEAMLATRVTDSGELLSVYESFRKVNPWMMDSYLASQGIKADPEDLLARKDDVYILRFEPTTEPGPLPMEVDLAWLWPVMMLWGALRRRKRRKRWKRRWQRKQQAS